MIPKLSEKFSNIRSIPQRTKPVTPVFTAGKYSEDDVANLLGKINDEGTKPEMRKPKAAEVVASSTVVQSTVTQKRQDLQKLSEMTTVCLSSAATEFMEIRVPGDIYIHHISIDKSGRLWVSGNEGNLVQIDRYGNELQKIQTSAGMSSHTVTLDGEVVFINFDNKGISKFTQGKTFTEFINTGGWRAISLYSSRINVDTLVAMGKDGEAKITRYNRTGRELQNIQRDNGGQSLYNCPIYITENINGDICVSEANKRTVVVVNKSGQFRFSYTGHDLWVGFVPYTGQRSMFCPLGICTDALGHILVCDQLNHSVHLVDKNGQFLSLLLTPQHGVHSPIGICVDVDNNLYVGSTSKKTVKVYKYLQLVLNTMPTF
jgi:hypothetical protein